MYIYNWIPDPCPGCTSVWVRSSLNPKTSPPNSFLHVAYWNKHVGAYLGISDIFRHRNSQHSPNILPYYPIFSLFFMAISPVVCRETSNPDVRGADFEAPNRSLRPDAWTFRAEFYQVIVVMNGLKAWWVVSYGNEWTSMNGLIKTCETMWKEWWV